MTGPYGGILGFITEASDIGKEFGVSLDEAWKIQRERQEARLQQYEAESPPPATNVLQFRPRGC